MTSIINKHNHPVLVKRIPVRFWALRDEIEDAIEREIRKQDNLDSPSIHHIKEFYTQALNTIDSPANEEEQESDENLDSSGNPLDDDAAAMMAALAGGDDETPSPQEEAQEGDSPEEDDEAAKLAAQMLDGQGSADSPEDEAAKLAAQMLEGQGGAESPEDEAAKLAAQMLEGQGAEGSTEEGQKEEQFTRQPPKESKIFEGFVLLSDIQMDQVLIFSKKSFVHGQTIIVEFMIPKKFSQIVEIKYNANITRNSRLISENKPHYRLAAKFLFKFPSERENLRSFLQSIEPDIPPPPKKEKSSKDDADDFDDLGF